MIDLGKLQKDIFAHKRERGFNTTNMELEFGFTYGELAEAFDSWRKKKGDVGEELADVAIYLLSLAEMNGVVLEEEILQKMAKNKQRKYENINGVQVKVSEE